MYCSWTAYKVSSSAEHWLWSIFQYRSTDQSFQYAADHLIRQTQTVKSPGNRYKKWFFIFYFMNSHILQMMLMVTREKDKDVWTELFHMFCQLSHIENLSQQLTFYIDEILFIATSCPWGKILCANAENPSRLKHAEKTL